MFYVTSNDMTVNDNDRSIQKCHIYIVVPSFFALVSTTQLSCIVCNVMFKHNMVIVSVSATLTMIVLEIYLI